jgi:hypothetical protein
MYRNQQANAMAWRPAAQTCSAFPVRLVHPGHCHTWLPAKLQLTWQGHLTAAGKDQLELSRQLLLLLLL